MGIVEDIEKESKEKQSKGQVYIALGTCVIWLCVLTFHTSSNYYQLQEMEKRLTPEKVEQVKNDLESLSDAELDKVYTEMQAKQYRETKIWLIRNKQEQQKAEKE